MPFGFAIARGVFNVFGLLLPGYASYKAIKSDNDELILQWIKYWIVICVFIVAESITDTFLYWLPLYYEAKMITILWLSLPYTQGATFIYSSYLEPFLDTKENEIDHNIARTRSISKRVFIELSQKGIFMLRKAVLASLMTPDIEPEFVKPKPSRTSSRRLERQLQKLSDRTTPDQGVDMGEWIAKERSRLRKLLGELDIISIDVGETPPLNPKMGMTQSTHGRSASVDSRATAFKDASKRRKHKNDGGVAADAPAENNRRAGASDRLNPGISSVPESQRGRGESMRP